MAVDTMPCKICQSVAAEFANAKILNKYDITYFRCSACGFIQTETPYWLDDAYSRAITHSDIGLVSRNLYTAKITQSLILTFYDANQKFLDYGGGYGLFVRMLRDRGFDFYRYDLFCENIFAQSFDAVDDGLTSYELVTAFEVFEHLVEPLYDIKQMLKYSRNILFTTTLVPNGPPKPDEWWYYGLEHGQHTSFYTYSSLVKLSKHLGLHLYSDRNSVHLLTQKKLNPSFFRLVLHSKVASFLNFSLRKPSLIPTDYKKITGHKLKD